MENELFESKGFDISDTFVFVFYDIVLKVKIGQYDVGTSFDYACLDYENGELTLGHNPPEDQMSFPGMPLKEVKFKLHFTVSEKADG